MIVVVTLMLIAIAVQIEKPSIRLYEQRTERLGTHFRKVAFAPDGKTAWAVGFNGMIVRSNDAGLNWKQQQSGIRARLYGLYVLDRNTVFSCGSEGTLVVTSNGGGTWKSLQIPTKLRLTDVFFLNRTQGWVVGDNGIVFKTGDAGKTWSQLETGYTSGLRSVWFDNETNGFIAGYEGLLLKTDDGGKNWNRVQTPEHISFYGSHFDRNESFYLVGSVGLMLESKDAGNSWDMLPALTTNFLRDIDVDSDGFGCIAGYGVILTKHPDSDQWHRAPDFQGLQFQSVAIGASGTAIAVGHWGAIVRTDDYGKTWSFHDRYFAPDMLDIAVNDTNKTAVAVGADGWALIQRQDDPRWFASHTGSRETLRSVAVDQKGRFWAVGGSTGLVFRYLPQRNHWTQIALNGVSDSNLNAITFQGDTAGFIVAEGGLLLSSDDIGESWSKRHLPTRHSMHGIHFTDNQNGFVFGDNGVVLATRNGGITWLGQFTGVTWGFRNGTFSHDGHAVLVSPSGVLESWSNGHNASWFETYFEFPAVSIAPGGRYTGMFNGDIYDRRTGVSRCVSSDPIHAFASCSDGYILVGAGRFGRITTIKSREVNTFLVRPGPE